MLNLPTLESFVVVYQSGDHVRDSKANSYLFRKVSSVKMFVCLKDVPHKTECIS